MSRRLEPGGFRVTAMDAEEAGEDGETDEWPRAVSHCAATPPPVMAATRRDAPGGVGYGCAAREPSEGERRRRVARGPEGDGDASGAAVVASGHDRGDARLGASRGGEERPRGAAHREGDVSGEQHGAGGCCSEWASSREHFYPVRVDECGCAILTGLLLLTPPKMVRLLSSTVPATPRKRATRADARGFERPEARSRRSITARADSARRSTFRVS